LLVEFSYQLQQYLVGHIAIYGKGYMTILLVYTAVERWMPNHRFQLDEFWAVEIESLDQHVIAMLNDYILW
jgi:hypothetical protein